MAAPKGNKNNLKHGMRYSRIYNIWRSMRQRCKNPNCKNYHNYGGRGISVCEDWNNFQNFYNWSLLNGYKENLTIDRIDVNGNYCPDNCRWVSYKVQENNRSNNRHIEIDGVTHTLGEWSDIAGVRIGTIYSRLKKRMEP